MGAQRLPHPDCTCAGIASASAIQIASAIAAQVTSVEASLEMDEDQIVFRVHDNGKGFDPEEAKAKKSLGLVGMQERAHLLQGKVTIEGIPGCGTTMILRIPVVLSAQPRQSL